MKERHIYCNTNYTPIMEIITTKVCRNKNMSGGMKQQCVMPQPRNSWTTKVS